MSDCGRCTAPAGDLVLCGNCAHVLRVDLRAVEDLAVDLDITLTRQDRVAGKQAGARSTETPLVFKPRASHALFTLRQVLGSWAIDIADRRDLDIDLRTLAEYAAFLLRYEHTIRTHPHAGRMVNEVRSAVIDGRRAIDTPLDQRAFLGPCDLDNESAVDEAGEPRCREELYCRKGQHEVTCPRCQSEWNVAERRSWMLAVVEDEVETAPVLSALLARFAIEVTPPQIQALGKVGRIKSISMDSHKRRRYRVGDVLDVFLPRIELQAS